MTLEEKRKLVKNIILRAVKNKKYNTMTYGLIKYHKITSINDYLMILDIVYNKIYKE